MELNQIQYFRAIAQQGSFSQAAQQLHLTQPALSKSMAKLEDELGAPLFERKGNRIALTAAGRTFLPYCGTVLNTVESGVAAFREVIGLKQGQLTIAISPEIYLKHLILRFLRENPQVTLTCHLMTGEEMSRALEEGSVDFVLSEQPVPGSNIQWQLLYRGRLTALFHPEDPLLTQKTVSMADLREHQFCIGHLRTDLSSFVFQLCREAGFEPRLRYVGYDPDTAGALLDLPNSVLISSDAIETGVRPDNAQAPRYPSVPISGTEGRACVGAAHRNGHYQSEAALAFFQMVSDYYKSL